MKFPRLMRLLPNWKNAALAVLSAILLILAFPDFEFWFLAWFGLVPLLWAIARESESSVRPFVLGWIWGFLFFTGTCWWLTFAPITYAGFPWALAYFLLFGLTLVVGVFPAIFAAILSLLIRRFGRMAFLGTPFVWVFTEFLRYWLTGNNWNALGYSQALSGYFVKYASIGGVYTASFALFVAAWVIFGWAALVISGSMWIYDRVFRKEHVELDTVEDDPASGPKEWLATVGPAVVILLFFIITGSLLPAPRYISPSIHSTVVAIQPNVPMSGLNEEKWRQLSQKHVKLAESALATINDQRSTTTTTVIFPESPMNFMWEENMEFQKFVRAFADRNNVQVLFNSAEPDGNDNQYFNSAVLVGTDGREIAQYDKIYLLPFGESVPAPLQSIVPAFVGSFSYGKEFDLLPLGDAKAGVMICFESHFGELSREYVRNGADAIIEMTNDGYLGPTPVLRQHLANAVFRAVETNRPVLRVTNVGITAYINERGEVLDAAESYTDATRVWSVPKSDGSQTFYVRYGDWFAWLCSVVTIVLLLISLGRRQASVSAAAGAGETTQSHRSVPPA